MFTAHLKNPPSKIFAFVHQLVKDQVMGMAITEKGTPIEAVILPTKQRVMLALGIGEDKANIHHTYRRLHPNGYDLIWIDDAKTDPRLARFRGEQGEASQAQEASSARHEPLPAERTGSPPKSPGESVDPTVALMQAGIATERRRGQEAKAGAESPAPGAAGQPQVEEDKASVREPVQSKPKKALDMFGGI